MHTIYWVQSSTSILYDESHRDYPKNHKKRFINSVR